MESEHQSEGEEQSEDVCFLDVDMGKPKTPTPQESSGEEPDEEFDEKAEKRKKGRRNAKNLKGDKKAKSAAKRSSFQPNCKHRFSTLHQDEIEELDWFSFETKMREMVHELVRPVAVKQFNLQEQFPAMDKQMNEQKETVRELMR